MDKVKIQEIAEEARLSNAELLDSAKELGFNVKAANSTISLEEAGILVDYAISGTLPKNWEKAQNKKSRSSYKSSADNIYKTPKKTKWAGITIVGKKEITDIDNTKKINYQKKKSSKKRVSVVKAKKQKKPKNSDISESSKKLLDSFEYSCPSKTQKKERSPMRRFYTSSERLALENGYEEIDDSNAYNGRYFIKNNLKWIHNIVALKKILGVTSDKEVRDHGYDVDMYKDIKIM